MSESEEKPINPKLVLMLCLTVIAMFTILLYGTVVVVSGELPDLAILETIVEALVNGSDK